MENNKSGIFRPTRGDIYLCNLGNINSLLPSGIRPVMVIQANELNKSSTVVVAPLSSNLDDLKSPCHVLINPEECLANTSLLMLEYLQTVNLIDLKGYCGCVISDSTWNKINEGIQKLLGLKGWKKSPVTNIILNKETTCLCNKCIRYYVNNPTYRIKQLTPSDGIKDTCDRCGQDLGFDYLITEIGVI